MTSRREMMVMLGAAVLATAGGAAQAQTVRSAEDCAIPGGCGNSGKPGGVERVPSEPSTSVLKRAAEPEEPTSSRRKKKKAAKAAKSRPSRAKK